MSGDRELRAVPAHVSGTAPMRTEQGDSTAQTQGDEQVSEQSASPKALARARVDVAEVFDDMLDTRWTADAYSNRALARRYLGVDERIVRKWRDGDKPIPLAALLALPLELSKDLAARVLSLRVGGHASRATSLLAESLEQIRTLVKSGYVLDASSVVPKLREAQRTLDSLLVELERSTRR